MTVSKVLNGYHPQREGAAKRAGRIRQIAEQVGYRPNASAQAMRSGRFNAVAMLVNDRENSTLQTNVLKGIGHVLQGRGFHLVLEYAGATDLENNPDSLPHILRQAASDGLLLHEVQRFPAHVVEAVKRHRIPAVWLNSRLEADCVYFDDYGATQKATRRLIGLGHRRIAYFGYSAPASHYSHVDRRAGYVDAMSVAGLPAMHFTVSMMEWYMSEGHAQPVDLMARWLNGFAKPERPTAIVCYESVGGAVAITAAMQLGLRVPTDISVIACGSSHFFAGHKMALARLDHKAFGEAAGEAIIDKISNPTVAMPPRVIDVPILDHLTLASAPLSVDGW